MSADQMAHAFSSPVESSSKRVEGPSRNWGTSHHHLECRTVEELNKVTEGRDLLVNIGGVWIGRLELHTDGRVGLIAITGGPPECLLYSCDHQVNLRPGVITLDERKSQQALPREIAHRPHVRLHAFLAATCIGNRSIAALS